MHASRGSNWKLWVLIAVLAIAVLVLGFLCVQYFLLGRTTNEPAVVQGTTVSLQDANGKNVTDSVKITEGTMRPDIADEDAELVLMNIDWTSSKDASYPLIVSVTNDKFTDNDGLSVYHYDGSAWELVGTYLISKNTVSFRADSLSPFAFEVISANPEPTVTPEPTATPEPTETPEPTATPYVIDYGTYDTIQAGTFVQADAIEEGGTYLIAIIDDPNIADNSSGVTFFDAADEDEPITATVLLNYDGKVMRTLELSVTKGTDGRYAIMDPVVDGMLWTAVDSDGYVGLTRYAMANNDAYLNIDGDCENFVMDDNAVRTRWLYETVTVTDEDGHSDDLATLTYYDTLSDEYFISDMSYDDGGDAMSFAATDDDTKAVSIVLFRQLQLSEDEYFTGTVILTGTPDALEGLDAEATAAPTATPDTQGGALVPVTPSATTAPSPVSSVTPAPTAKPTAVPTTAPTAVPTAVPTTAPTTVPTAVPASGSDSGGDSGTSSDTDAG